MKNIFVIGYSGLGLDIKSSKLLLLSLGLFYWSFCFVGGSLFPLGNLFFFSSLLMEVVLLTPYVVGMAVLIALQKA